uniref:Uncharacterized protein n=1 Tax=Babesia bovis TaxID=5865 RepID=A7AWZ1_BABBO|eukprot:XP_001609137.1 hypothetical protein [Babesia bovis T2Bo]
MGGRLSTKRSSSRKCSGKASIFELLLQLTKLEVTDTDSSELDEWMQQLFVTSIDDVSYDAIETYFKNFVFYNLLQANLSHGHIAKYWERYALFLRYIMDKDRATTLREFDLNDGDPIKTLLTEESVDDGSNKPSTEEPPVKQDISCPTNPHNSGSRPSTGNNDPNAESLYMAFGLDDEPGGRQMGLGRRLMAKARALEMEEARNRMITSQESVTSELCDMVVNEPLGENVTEIYEKLRSGKGDTTKYLTPFVISKIFMKCLVDSLNAVELLFHMDYLSYYLEWTTKPIYKLNADDGISLVKGDVTNRSDGSNNEVNTGQNSDLNEEGPDDIDENPCVTDNVVKEIKKLVKLRSANETVPITAVIRMEAPLILLEEAITSAAAEAWSSPTLEAMKRGYCFIDHKMRIFSLKSIENILKNTNEVVEFMVIPFCTINYGGANVSSNLQNLTTTLIEYVTANIIPHTNAHDTFIKATQSMAADLLTILLSTIVMTPYICTFATSNQDFTYPTSFTWITRIHKRTKAVAPYYYIHMECLRQQMIENPEKLSVKQLQHVVDYYNKKHAPMAYWMLESMRHKIGRSHFMALIQCLIRLFSTTTHHTGHKRHLNNLRNHAVMYILLLVNAEERDQVIFLDEQGKPKESSSSSDASDYDGAEVEAIMRRARLLIPYNLQDQFTKQKTWSFKWVCDVVLPSQMAALAKAMQNMPPTKICNNELWLMLVELLMNDSNFKFTFYAKPAAFIKELMASIKTICILPKEHGKHDPERKSRSKSNTIPTTASPYIRTAIKLLTHYVVHQKVVPYLVAS